MTLISSLNIAREALSVNQDAITVVSNNISNVNTAGYSKLRISQSEVVNTTPLMGNSAQIEANTLSGVQLDSITRYSDSYLEGYYNSQYTSQSYYTKYSNIATNINGMMNELNNTGLTDALDKFYTAASALSQNSSDKTLRQNYLSAAESVCTAFNNISSSLSNLQKSYIGTPGDVESSEIYTDVKSANSLIDQLSQVNKSITACNGADGTSSAALLDQRDALVTKLSALMPVTTSENKNGTVDVKLGDCDLVSSTKTTEHLSVTNNGSGVTLNVVDPNTNAKIADVTSDVTSGTLGAIIDACGTNAAKLTISSTISELDNMASSFAKVMNDIQTKTDYPTTNGTPMCMNSTGTALQASSATNFMFVNGDTTTASTPVTATSANGITAGNITVNYDLVNNPYNVAAARQTTINTTATGNNSNMALVAAARTDSSYYTAAGTTNTKTLETSLSDAVTDVGSKVSSINSSLSTQTSVVSQIKSNLSSETGVNLDEELSDMIKYQRAYQSAARVFSTVNDLLGELVQLGQ